MAVDAGGLLDRVCTACRLGSIRFETDGRVFVDQSSRLLPAWALRYLGKIDILLDRRARGAERRVYANLQSRHYSGSVVLLCWLARTAARFAWHRRFRRADATDALALRLDERRNVFVVRLARTEWVHRRIPNLQRRVRD